jgi:predicted regulator of amino acid metabolism with ACT domain
VSTLITGKKVDMASIKKYLGVVEISIKSPEQIEIMPGVVSTIYNKIAETGINIIETYSSYNETIFIIDKKDLTLMIEVLDRLGIG